MTGPLFQAPGTSNDLVDWVSVEAADTGVFGAAGLFDITEVRSDVTIPALAAGESMQVRNSTDTPVNLLGAGVVTGTPPMPVLSIPEESLLLVVSDGTTLRGSVIEAVEVSGRYLGPFVDVASIAVPAGMAGSATPEDGDKAKVGDPGQETLHIYADGEWIDVEESERITPSAAILPTPGSDTPNSLIIPKLRDGNPLSEAHFFVGDRRAGFTARRATIVLTVSEMVGTVTKTVVLPGTYNFTFVWTEDADNYYVDVAGTHVGQLDVFNANYGVTPFYQAPATTVTPWLPSTAATAVEDGDRLIVMPGSTLTLPAIPAAGDSVVVYLAPDSKWEGLAYTINTAGADTFPTVEVFGNARVTAIGLPGETEWRVYEGADGAIESNIVVNTRTDLPAAPSLMSGRTGVILDENGAISTALGTAGQPAVGWSI